MGRTRYKVTQKNVPHFLTMTVNNWIPVFTRPETIEILYQSWNYLQQKRDYKLYGYVVLENHIHLIAQSDDLNRDIKAFKAYTARNIIDHLKSVNATFLLKQLAFYKKAHKTNSDYQLWQEGTHPQLMSSEAMLRQKLEYIHLNPVKRGYVDVAEHWRYSSARQYQGLESSVDVFADW